MTTHAPSPAQWQAIEPLLDAALTLPSVERQAFLATECDDQALRDELNTMLIACERLERHDGLLSQPAGERFASLWDEADDDARFAAALADRYVIDGIAGRGGMSVVYRARDAKQNRPVAVKVLRTTIGKRGPTRFRREISFAAALQHPYILSVLDSGEDAGRLWYAMPFVDGETLGARLRRDSRLEIAEAVRLLRQISMALDYAHASGVIHRDLKPDNVLISNGRAIIADFGIAKALVAAAASEHATLGLGGGETTAGVRVGTPAYMAPEQGSADPSADHRVDLYALGVIAYQLIAGQTPFTGATRQALLTAHLAQPPAPLGTYRANVPEALDRLVMRLLAKRAEDRPESAAVVLAELSAISKTTSKLT